MHGIKILCSKNAGGAYAQGGHICGTLWYMILDMYIIIYS